MVAKRPSLISGRSSEAALPDEPTRNGQAFAEIAREPEVATALFDVLETQRILASSAKIALLPGGPHGRMLAKLMAAEKQG